MIGGGSAGLTAARTARLLGARVLLIERGRLGGDCLWTGCVPSKALIATARAAAIRSDGSHGDVAARAEPAESGFAFAAAIRARARIAPVDSQESLERLGVTVRIGDAAFDSARSVVVDGELIRFQHAVIATGSHPVLPLIPGLDQVDPLTSDTVWDLEHVPASMLIVGGGAVACELGQAFARLGSAVTIVHRRPDILPDELPDGRAVIRRSMVQDGVRFVAGHTLAACERTAAGGVATLDDGTRIPFDRVLVAAGRAASVDGLGLDAAGVSVDGNGWVRSDPSLRTANPAIWAAGDATWVPKHTHTAGVSGALVARNALLGTTKRFDAATEPRAIFTAPEIAAVGVQHAGRDRSKRRAVTVQHRHVDRAVAEDEADGFTRIIVNGRGRILGGTIVGPRAGETLGELSLAVAAKLTVAQLSSATHPYPTFSDGLWNAAIIESQRRIRDGLVGRAAGIMRHLTAWRGARAERRA